VLKVDKKSNLKKSYQVTAVAINCNDMIFKGFKGSVSEPLASWRLFVIENAECIGYRPAFALYDIDHPDQGIASYIR
jgi:hypothetical protein